MGAEGGWVMERTSLAKGISLNLRWSLYSIVQYLQLWWDSSPGQNQVEEAVTPPEVAKILKPLSISSLFVFFLLVILQYSLIELRAEVLLSCSWVICGHLIPRS